MQPKTPIRFVHRHPEVWDRLTHAAMPPLPHEAEPRFPVELGTNCWIVQTWIHLKRLGLPVELGRTPRSDRINVIHYDHLGLKAYPFLNFYIAVQADRGRPELCDLRVVQNELGVRDPSRDFSIPLWTQAGLRPRAADRGLRFERVAYFGLEWYLAERFRDPDFHRRLAAVGVEFSLRTDPGHWTRYDDVDGVLAVRDVSPFHLSIKPPSKLVNAWTAGVVPLMGREPAYWQVRRSELDYVEVESPEDVLHAIACIKSSPSLLRDILDSGARRASAFSDAMIAKRWVELLEGPAQEAYDRWRRSGSWNSRLRSLPHRYRSHAEERKYYFANL